jgi:hypothetical protein
MTASPNALRQLTEEVGALVARHAATPQANYRQYADDPCGFIRDVLRETTIWSRQGEIAELVRDHAQVVVRSCNGAGKDWLAARLALWWVYARSGYVLVTGPSERQVKTVVMGEMARAFNRAPGLPGRMFEMALKVDGESTQRGVLAFTSNEANRLTGFHAPNLFIIITEAQGVEPFAWEAMFANASGEGSRLLAVGNPLVASGRYFDICRATRWQHLKIDAFQHPNLIEQRNVIPGAVTHEAVDRIEAEYGLGSDVYRSRVLAEFPEGDAAETLVARSWLEAAAARWTAKTLESEAWGQRVVVAIDVARYGSDKTVMCIRQGPVVREMCAWEHLDTMQTCGRIIMELERRDITPRIAGGAAPLLVVDATGVGAGVYDRFHELGRWQVKEFQSGHFVEQAAGASYLNRRAAAYWGLRRLLEMGKIALPPDPVLFEELVGTGWKTNSAGKIQIESKDDIRARLGRSPDRADAVAMACDGMYVSPAQVWRTVELGF